jgi:hypothetical protein
MMASLHVLMYVNVHQKPEMGVGKNVMRGEGEGRRVSKGVHNIFGGCAFGVSMYIDIHKYMKLAVLGGKTAINYVYLYIIACCIRARRFFLPWTILGRYSSLFCSKLMYIAKARSTLNRRDVH